MIGSDDALDVEPGAGSWPRIGFNVARIVGAGAGASGAGCGRVRDRT